MMHGNRRWIDELFFGGNLPRGVLQSGCFKLYLVLNKNPQGSQDVPLAPVKDVTWWQVRSRPVSLAKTP